MEKSSHKGFDPGGFSNVDATGDASEYAAYLEQTGSRLRELSRARYELLDLHPGDHILDVGCGIGDDARELAGLVGPRGKVVALDSSEELVGEARRRTGESQLSVEFAVGDAHDLKFADASFAACWSERVLQHLADPAGAIAQMVRVIRPGGRVVAFEPDHSTLVLDAADRVTTRSIVLTLADSIRSSWIGRSLFGLFKANGLQDVMVIPTPLISQTLSNTKALLRLDVVAQLAVKRGSITPQAASRWFADLGKREHAGRFFGCLLCFAVVGTKPKPAGRRR